MFIILTAASGKDCRQNSTASTVSTNRQSVYICYMADITLVGAGLVGALEALYLSRLGLKVDVYERRSDIRKAKLYEGRSINLALSDRGWAALEEVGLAEEVRKIAIPMYKRTMHSSEGQLSYQAYGKEGQAIYSVSRGKLNQLLIEAADAAENTRFFFEHRCEALDLESKTLTFSNAQKQEISHSYQRLIGTDGAFSAVRQALMFQDRFNYQQFYIEHGYKELTIPPAPDGGFLMEKETLHIWPRGSFMLIALPNPDATFTCTLFFPFEGPVSFEQLQSEEQIRDFFNQTFPDVVPLIPDLVEQYQRNPSSSLVTIRCKPWNYKDEVLVLGDAAHAIVPFYGQGMNAGFEDCRLFHQMLNERKQNWDGLFPEYAQHRQPDGVAISELALRNFIEMRDRTADPSFLLQKKIEARFAERHPDKWLPLYSMVTFSHIPYSEALAKGDAQEAIMQKVMQLPNIESRWDSVEVEQAILQQLAS